MYLYRLVWSYYESFEFYELMHEKQFGKDEFKKMCDEAVRFAVKELLKRSPEKNSEIDFCHPDFMFLMVKFLEEKYGFKKIEPTATVEYVGMAEITSDWEAEELEQFRKIVGEELYTKVLIHNDKMRGRKT